MTESKERIPIFDLAKGLSIILMTLSGYNFIATYPSLQSFQNVAMVFKMPTFIFISGYLLSDRLDYKSFVGHKIDGLLKPLLGFIISLTAIEIIIYTLFSEVVTIGGAFEFVKNVARSFYHGQFDVINESFWFIGALFLAQLAFRGVIEITRLETPLKYVFLLLFFIVLVVLNELKTRFFWTEYLPTFCTYLLLGYSCKKINNRYFKGTAVFYNPRMLVFPILFCVSWFVLHQQHIDIVFGIGALHFNFHYLLLLSVFGVFSVIYFCTFIERIPVLNSILVFCSRASFFILAYHLIIEKVFSLVVDTTGYKPLLHTFLFFFNITVSCFIFVFLKKIPVVRLLFYPIKTIALNDREIEILQFNWFRSTISKNIS